MLSWLQLVRIKLHQYSEQYFKSKLTAIVLETDAGTCRRLSVTDLTEQYSYDLKTFVDV